MQENTYTHEQRGNHIILTGEEVQYLTNLGREIVNHGLVGDEPALIALEQCENALTADSQNSLALGNIAVVEAEGFHQLLDAAEANTRFREDVRTRSLRSAYNARENVEFPTMQAAVTVGVQDRAAQILGN